MLLALGITGVHDAGISKIQAEVYMSMADDSELNIRVYAMLSDAGANLDAFPEPVRRYSLQSNCMRTARWAAAALR
jgi:predicted amidohydrolase YtcJ